MKHVFLSSLATAAVFELQTLPDFPEVGAFDMTTLPPGPEVTLAGTFKVPQLSDSPEVSTRPPGPEVIPHVRNANQLVEEDDHRLRHPAATTLQGVTMLPFNDHDLTSVKKTDKKVTTDKKKIPKKGKEKKGKTDKKASVVEDDEVTDELEIEDLLDPTTSTTSSTAEVPVLPSRRAPPATTAALSDENGTGKMAVLPVVCALLSQLLI
ncbi:MAG: uncharacterized protein KVP18_005041 [Porospora cf. gigantea A]|uniref:uncharacterized protein n=1 Tax=Porospora cf. gigantea A TaxID=2853593 RepID=UPI003559CDE7|nr:MAG: hypothetical protein KVP18_005041 [Porospora cf. gigantea A]